MPNTKISNLTSAGTLTGSEVAPIVQSGITVKATAQNIANLAIPSQAGNSGKYLTTDGTTTSWNTVSGGGKIFTGSVYPAGSSIFLTQDFSTLSSPVAAFVTSSSWEIQCNAFTGNEMIWFGSFVGQLAIAPFTPGTFFPVYGGYTGPSTKKYIFNVYDINGNQLSPLTNYQGITNVQLLIYQS